MFWFEFEKQTREKTADDKGMTNVALSPKLFSKAIYVNIWVLMDIMFTFFFTL